MFNRENKFNKNSEKDKKAQLEKKKLLQSKFSKFEVSYQPETKQKEKCAKSTSSDSTLKDTISQLKKELKSEKESNKMLKRNIFELNNTLKTNSTSYDSLLSQFNLIIEELKQVKIDFQNLSKSISTETLSKLSVESALMKKENMELKLRCKYFQNENNILKKEQHLNAFKEQIATLTSESTNYRYQISTYDKKMDDLRLEALKIQNEMQKEIDHLRKVIIDISSSIDLPPIDELLTFMEVNLNLENYREYDKIHYILWKINKLRNENSSIRRKQSRIEYIPQHSLYGYLIKKEDCFYFSSIQGEVYPIDSCKTKLKKDFIEDKPSRASIRDGYARLEAIYEDIDIEQKLGKRGKYYDYNNKNLTEINIQMDKVTFKYPFKILIVGSRNKEVYVNKLKSHGLEVDWHDSYEDYEGRLQLKFLSADVVIICTSHTAHGTINAINKHDSKVELIKRDNANTILHRARYALIRLGILDKGNEESMVAMTDENTKV